MEAADAGVKRLDADGVGRQDFPQHAIRGRGKARRSSSGTRKREGPKAARRKSRTWDGRSRRPGHSAALPLARNRRRTLAETVRPRKRNQDEAEHVVADARQRRQTRVGRVRQRHGGLLRSRGKSEMEIRHPETSRESRRAVRLWFVAAAA